MHQETSHSFSLRPQSHLPLSLKTFVPFWKSFCVSLKVNSIKSWKTDSKDAECERLTAKVKQQKEQKQSSDGRRSSHSQALDSRLGLRRRTRGGPRLRRGRRAGGHDLIFCFFTANANEQTCQRHIGAAHLRSAHKHLR